MRLKDVYEMKTHVIIEDVKIPTRLRSGVNFLAVQEAHYMIINKNKFQIKVMSSKGWLSIINTIVKAGFFSDHLENPDEVRYYNTKGY